MVKIVFVQNAGDDIAKGILVCRVVCIRYDLAHHFCDRDVGAAVLGALEGSDGGAERGVEICACGTDHDVGEGGVVTAAVIRVDQQDRVKEICLVIRELSVRAQHIEDILRNRVLPARIVDDQRIAVEGMYLGVVGVAAQGRELGDQVDSLEQVLIDIRLVR